MKEVTCFHGEKLIVDDADYEEVSKYVWYFYKDYYPVAKVNGVYQKVHRFLLRNKNIQGLVVHHKNGNRLDNRRVNLGVMSNGEHMSYHKSKNKYERLYLHDTMRIFDEIEF